MKNEERIGVNPEEYIIYRHKNSKRLFAVEKKHLNKIESLIIEYKSQEKIPSSELIDGYFLELNKNTKLHDIISSKSISLPLNDFETVWVEFKSL